MSRTATTKGTGGSQVIQHCTADVAADLTDGAAVGDNPIAREDDDGVHTEVVQGTRSVTVPKQWPRYKGLVGRSPGTTAGTRPMRSRHPRVLIEVPIDQWLLAVSADDSAKLVEK
ncbi:hypothetical protein HCA61_03395 [Rhodococcus sp. HNM0563]|uniref:hypothetical protein n=1 Tax=Rhodococcus sp. HNM0563 TaxID=2716339 RepID=UPI00146B428A|nr:hypothetical protein [Rhodococcus sp. HNM0563]NLU61308.1 hypothetical protein [Rhodococcus sp. HNM0563]